MATLGSQLFQQPSTSARPRKVQWRSGDGDDDDISSFASDDSFVNEFFGRLDHRSPSFHPDETAEGGEIGVDAAAKRVRGVSVRGDVESGETRDFAFKVEALHNSLTPEMRAEVEAVKKQRRAKNEPLSDFDRDCIARGIDPEVLRDLKVAFTIVRDGIAGVRESEFMSTFGPRLCSNLTTEEIRLWFRNIDANCSGAVSWPEIAEYVSEYRSDNDVSKSYFVDFTIEGTGAQAKKPHKQLVSKLLYNASLDVLYSCSADGLVKAWEPRTLRALPKPVHNLGVSVLDMTLCPHNNRLVVLQSDRTMFMYDTFIDAVQTKRHELFRGFATHGKSVRTLHDGTSFYDVAEKNDRARLHGTVSMVPVSLLLTGAHNYTCLDNLGGASHGEPIALGTEGGTVELTSLVLGSVRPIAPTSVLTPHADWVTSVHHAPDIMALVTSSIDGTLAVTDLETGARLQSLCVPSRKKKPVYACTYHRHHSTLISCVGRSLHVWNALTGAHLTKLSDHDGLLIGVAINPDRQHAYALQENKKVKVWDLRTWRAIGEAEDVNRRTPHDGIGSLIWCESNTSLVCASSTLFGWRPTDVQEKLSAGLRATDTETKVHLAPVASMHCINAAGHIWSIDTHRGFVWGADGKHLLKMWNWVAEDDTITTSCMDLEGLRALVGTERGLVQWVNYTNGFVINRLHHDKEATHVSCLKVTKGILDESPPLAFAGIGRHALGWMTDRSYMVDVKSPAFVFTLPADIPGKVEAILEIHPERKIMAVIATYGHTILLTVGLAPLATFSVPGLVQGAEPVAVDSALLLMPGLVAYGCSDGMVRVQAFSVVVGFASLQLACFRAAFGSEGITAMCRRDHHLIVADGDGVVSVFECSKLLDDRYIAKEALPHLNDPVLSRKLPNVCGYFLELKHAFRAHSSAVVSIGMSAADELITAGMDKHVRAWSGLKFNFVADVGRKMVATLEEEFLDAADSKLPLVGEHACESHPFNSEMHNPGLSLERRQSLSFVMPLMPLGRAGSLLSPKVKGSGVTSPAAPASRRNSVNPSGHVTFPQLAKVPKALTPAPRTVSTLTGIECFRRSTDRLVAIKAGTLQRDVPLLNRVHDQLSDVGLVRARRAQEVREETKRAFSMLSLPPVPNTRAVPTLPSGGAGFDATRAPR
jgi:WD40 repeat protein